MKNKFSKDPKVSLITLEEFILNSDYFLGITPNDLWNDDKKPTQNKSYYKFTPSLLINVCFGSFTNYYVLESKEILRKITVAYRDGKTEYDLFDNKIKELMEERINHKKNKKLDEQIEALVKAKNLMPKFEEPKIKLNKPFDSYLIDTGYVTSIKDIKNKYLVLDVETNGLRTSNDDLLSLSIYDPTTGICYNRYFPLTMQPLILTGYIHGITDKTIADAVHMSQEEMNWLIDYFHMRDRIILSYSGGQGLFDYLFVQNYCKRQGIIGFEDLKFENIKKMIPKAPFGSEGELTKDNLCEMFNIDGVNKIHSSYNDCILEWKLFEKLAKECVFFIGNHLFKYTPEYIIPFSYLFKHPDLVKYANINIPDVKGTATEVFRFDFPKKLMKEIKKFPTNITGITIEHGINSYLEAEEQNNFEFLSKNKSHLKYVGSIGSKIKEIPIITEDDGTVRALRDEDKVFINQVNDVTKIIIEQIKPVADYLKDNIFNDNKIMTQELSITDDQKVLALCDLSDSKNVVEIKTYNIFDKNDEIDLMLARQLYYQSKGRNTYVLSIEFDTHYSKTYFKTIVDGLHIHIYKIDLSFYDKTKLIQYYKLNDVDIDVLKELKNYPDISKSLLAAFTGCNNKEINEILNLLENLGYIKKENSDNVKSSWIVLRDVKDKITQYTFDGHNYHIID